MCSFLLTCENSSGDHEFHFISVCLSVCLSVSLVKFHTAYYTSEGVLITQPAARVKNYLKFVECVMQLLNLLTCFFLKAYIFD